MSPVKTKPLRNQPPAEHEDYNHGHNPKLSQTLLPLTDYDTDTFYPSDAAGSLHAPASTTHQLLQPGPLRTADDLNLSVLRRYNSSIRSIEAVAPYAVLYIFSYSTQKWEKCNIEGSLFVCQLQEDFRVPGMQQFAAIILNRRGLENFAAYLETSQAVEITDDYIILQVEEDTPNSSIALALQGEEATARTKVYGLWIFSETGTSTAGTRVHIADVMTRCAAVAEASRIYVENVMGDTLQMPHNTTSDQFHGPSTGISNNADTSAATDRQLSLRELFDQQQEPGSELRWPVNHHSTVPATGASQTRQGLSDTGTFMQNQSASSSTEPLAQPLIGRFPMNSETGIFQHDPMTAITARHMTTGIQNTPQDTIAGGNFEQPDLLRDLFQKASQGR